MNHVRHVVPVVILAACISTSAPAQHCKPAGDTDARTILAEKGAPLFAGLGAHSMKISTASPEAQRYFDQGLTLLYAFNHKEAVRSFKQAAAIDDGAPMPWWGVAIALGPHINAPMTKDAAGPAWEAIGKARERLGKASPVEAALVNALAARYASEYREDRKDLDVAYMNAMRPVAKQFPDATDVQTLFADATMNTTPWDYWREGGALKPEMAEALAALDRAIALDPKNPGAHHLLIHAVEAGPHPERGLPSADALRDLCTSAGHLVHMPAHIYLRVGLYSEASRANVLAIGADESYIAQCGAQGFYPLTYYPHNQHFLWYTSMIEGRSAEAIDLARKVAPKVTDEYTEADRLRPMVVLALARFGRWDELLAEPAPDPSKQFAAAMDAYARGLAHAARGRPGDAKACLSAIDALIASDEGKALEIPFFYGQSQLKVARDILAAAAAKSEGRADEAVASLRRAVAAEDALPYMEPPYWAFPTRPWLGAALLTAGKAAEAERVFRDDLDRHPANGWALAGLVRSLSAQNKRDEAAEVQRQFRQAWLRADVQPAFSPF